MCDSNYGGFDYVRIQNPLGIVNVCAKLKNSIFNPVTDDYTLPLTLMLDQICGINNKKVEK